MVCQIKVVDSHIHLYDGCKYRSCSLEMKLENAFLLKKCQLLANDLFYNESGFLFLASQYSTVFEATSDHALFSKNQLVLKKDNIATLLNLTNDSNLKPSTIALERNMHFNPNDKKN